MRNYLLRTSRSSWLNWRLFLFLLAATGAQSQPLLTESFNYNSGTLLAATNWAPRASGTPAVSVVSGNLAFSNTIASNFGNKVALAASGQDVYRTFTATNATAYSSLVVNVSAAQAAGDYFYILGNVSYPHLYGAKIHIRSNGSGFSFGVSRGNSATPVYETTERAFGTNYFIVLKYEVVAGTANDLVKLYVDHATLLAEPTAPSVAYSAAEGSDITASYNLSSVNLYQGTAANAPTLELDGIQVGTNWLSVATAQYDYGDAPNAYELSKDGIYAPAAHAHIEGFRLGSVGPFPELAPNSVAADADNNEPNGDGDEEDAIALPIEPIKQGLPYSLIVPVNSPNTATKYLYAWIDFNNNGRFEAGELTNATLNFTTSGATTRTLTWTNAQTATIPAGVDKLYMRLRLTNRALVDFTTAASGGATLDERSIGNGAISASNAGDHGTVPAGEGEDYQLDVVRLYDFGDLPASFEDDKDGNSVPARHAALEGLSIGALLDIESGPYSVADGDDNNDEGDNEFDLEDEDGLTEFISVSRGVAYSIDVPVNAPAGTKYLYAWLDLNGDGHFQANELTTATPNFTITGSSVRTLTWSAVQTTSIPVNTKDIYLRLRLSNTQLLDFTTAASGGATIDERSIGSGATATNNATLVSTIAFGEVEDYQLRVDDYDFGDAPVSYENGVPARQIALPTRHIGSIVQNESTPNNVAAGADNNGINGDGEEEDGITGDLPVIVKGTPFSFTVPVTVNVASSIIAWIDFNNDGKFQLSEAAYTAASGTSQAYQTAAVGTNDRTFYFRGSQTNTIPDDINNVYVRIRLTQTAGADAAGTGDIDERSIGDGLSTGVYGIPSIGEVEDYRFPVLTDLDYGDAPVSYEQNQGNDSRPARNYPTDNLFIGQSYVLESSPSSVTSGADNNAPNGDGDEEDGIDASQLFVRLGGSLSTNIYSVTVNNTTGAAATLHGWIDFNNNGRFEVGEYASVGVPHNTNGPVSLPFTATQAGNIPAAADKLYMRLRLIQANAEVTIADLGGGANAVVDERSIADGLSTGEYASVSLGEVEDYQLTIIKDYGDAPVSYENGNPAFQSNTPAPELYLGASVDYELAPHSVAAGEDNNGTNGDGADEDAVTEQHTITVGAPFTLTVPVTSTSTGAKSLYAWIDFNGDGIFNGNEVATPVSFGSAVGVTNVTLNWTGTQTSTATPDVITAGKTYIRIRLSAATLTNSNSGTLTLIDTRSFGPGNASGEVEDYQFLVSNLNDYGDAPASYEMNANAAPAAVPARQAASNSLRLGLTVDNESTPASVADGDDNNDANGDGSDEDGIIDLAPLYSGIAYRTQVSLLNNTGANRTLYGWIDFNNNGRFESSEAATLTVPSSAQQQTVTLSWTAQTFTPPAGNKLYMRLRISEGTLTDRTGAPNPALVDERAIGDGLASGEYGTLQPGEIEDYQLTVISEYDYGDVDPASYESNDASANVPARQAVSQGLYLGQLYADAEPDKQVTTDAQGDNSHGTNDEDGAVPGPITAGGGYTLNVTFTNNSGAARTLYGWIDFNNNGRFESGEVATVSLANNTYNGIASLSWITGQTTGLSGSQLNMRLRVSEGALTTNSATVDERAIADGLNTGAYAANAANGEIEDYVIAVTTDLDYGDVPVSYEQPGGALRPARQISNAALQIGGTPDVEPAAQSVAPGADNNGTNGDGQDEDGIVPENHAVTVNSVFTLPVSVTNTTGTARALYGWLDLNGNGTFDDGEMTTVSVGGAVNNGTVNLSWTAAQTRGIQTDKVYLRLRLADAALTNNTGTGYDERAFGDGLSTGEYGAAATRGEIEDYQLAVIPAFDFGDAPVSFEQNNTDVAVPARHLTTATLYLGSTYSLDYGPSNVADGADNNGTNGEGEEEDGIASLPVFYPGGAYSVPVNVFKSISGTGTVHAWIDLNGDGRFSVGEYTSATVTAATGAQTVNLLWSAAPYTSTNNYTYMRLRFTTNTLTDLSSTAAVDERSIGDGASTGSYGNPVNGEIEDYLITVDNTGIPAAAPCFGLGAIDPIQAAFHATMVRPASGGYLVFGESAHGNGSSNLNTPAKLENGSNGFNFQGDVLMATLASTYINYHQYFTLTTAGLYAWGVRGIAIPTAATSGRAMQPIDLPPGTNPARVKMIDAGASYTGQAQGSLAVLTTAGEIWVRTSFNAANTTNDFNAVQGDGNLSENNGSTGWHQVQTAAGVPLTGMVDVRSTGAAMIATDGTNFYTWGRNVYTGTGAAATLHYATPMTLPPGFATPALQVDLSYGTNLSASYYILDNSGTVHVLGNNDVGQLGLGTTTAQTSWQQITTINEQPDDPGKQPDVSRPIGKVTLITANNHDSNYGHLIVITEEQIAYHTGSNSGGGGMSGTVNANNRTVLTAMTTANGTMMLPGKMVFGEAGGHIGVLAKEGSDRYGYVGHTINGSDGCGGCTNNPSEYNFERTTSTGPLCGIEAFDYGDLDDRYNNGDKARHQIRYAQSENPLKLGTIAADSDDAPQITATGNDNLADGDDSDEKGDDEDAFAGALPVKTAGLQYTLEVPLTNNTGTTAYLYGFIDWNADGVFSPAETVTATVPSSATAQTATLTWEDPGFDAAQCAGEMDYLRSFVRLRLTTTALSDDGGTPEDDRSHLAADDGEVEDYYLDWTPPFENFDYGNLPTAEAPVIWPQASATLLSLDLSNTTRVWLGDDESYPNTACVSNEDRNGGLIVTQAGSPVPGDGSAGNPFVVTSSATPFELAYAITVNGNGAANTPVYWAVWYDANGNGSFIDADDVFSSGVTNHGSPVTISEPFILNPGGTNTGAANGAIRIVATANSTSFSKELNGTVSVENGEVEDFYVIYSELYTVSGTIFNDNDGQTGGADGDPIDGTDVATPLFVNLYDSDGNFVQSAPVGADGTYTFTDIPAGTGYQIQVSTVEAEEGDVLEADAPLPGTFANVSSNGETGGHTDGVIGFDITSEPVTGLDFGINQAPVADSPTLSPQTNPGGTTSVDITGSFTGTDPNDGEITSVTITEFPENATSITVGTTTYYPTEDDIPGGCTAPECAVFPTEDGIEIPVTAGVPDLPVSIDPVDGEITVTVPYVVTDEAGLTSEPAEVSVPFGEGYTVSGTIFNDNDGQTGGADGDPIDGTDVATPLFVNLYDSDGNFVQSAPVGADGTYTFTDIPAGTGYQIQVSTVEAEEGDVLEADAPLPGTFANVSSNGETGGHTDGVIGFDITSEPVTGLDFGINQAPVADSPTLSPQTNPGGTTSVDITGSFTGTDPNDGEITSVTITEFPENATSITVGTTTYYPTEDDIPGGCTAPECAVFPTEDGIEIPVTAGVPDLPVSIDPVDGEITVTVPYVVTDEAGLTSEPAEVSVPFGEGITISGVVYTDANGNGEQQSGEDGTDLGTGTLTVYLVNAAGEIVDKATVAGDGSYTVNGAEGVAYTLVLSNDDTYEIGDTDPVASLPTGGDWEYENTGETFGNGNNAGTGVETDTPGIIAVTPDGVVTGVNFGVNGIPVANDVDNGSLSNSAFSSTTPTGYEAFETLPGYVSIPYSDLTNPMNGADQEDGTLNDNDATITFTNINDNTVLYYDFGTGDPELVTEGMVVENFDPGKLLIYGEVGSGDLADPLGFEYQLTDAAGAVSEPATFTLSTNNPLPVTLVNFEATREGSVARLSWATTLEVNSDHFEVEHSTDSRKWTVIGRRTARGESSGRTDYGFVHDAPASGINYYRLTIVDRDGTSAQSGIRSVEIEGTGLTLYPNPVESGMLTLDIADAAGSSVKVYNAAGIEVISQTLGSRMLDVRKLPSGIYMISLTTRGGATITKSFVVK